MSTSGWRGQVYGWLLLLPAAVLLVAFTHFPVGATLYHSFFSNPRPGRAAVWVGADNYRAMVEDPVFWQVLGNNVWFALGTIPLSIGLAMLSAIPFGVLTDRMNRARIIAIGFVPWAVGMLLQSVATTFAVLVAARVLLGSIEASNSPASQSMLGDYYEVGRRSRILGIWRLGEVIGSSIGFAVAAAIADVFGWRWSFASFGLLGVVCAVVVWRALPEPPLAAACPASVDPARSGSRGR